MTVLADEAKKLMDELETMGLDEEDVPEEISNLADDPSEDDQRKADHAYKQLRERLRVAKSIIGQQGDELEAGREKQAIPEAQPTSNLDPQQRSSMYLATLQTRAMQKMGVPDVNSPLVQMEIQRLYSLDMEMAEKQTTAVKDAEVTLNQAYDDFPQLGNDDKRAIEEALATRNILDRTDSAVVTAAIHTHLGANLDKFTKTPESTDPKIKKSSAGAAAISNIKARGGVGPGEANPSGEPTLKAATHDEMKEMKKLNIPLGKIELYRKAKLKKENYIQ